MELSKYCPTCKNTLHTKKQNSSVSRYWGETPYASLVQLVERRSPKPDVEGSSPSGRDL